MKVNKFDIQTATRYLKAGYRLKSIIDRKEEYFVMRNDIVFVLAEQKGIKLDLYTFADLYKDCVFEKVEVEEEETVDIKKDEEYYSWHQ